MVDRFSSRSCTTSIRDLIPRVWHGVTWSGLILLALAPNYSCVLLAAALVGLGSAVFHPESSRMARLASGGRHGFAQSFSKWGGNAERHWPRCSRQGSSCSRPASHPVVQHSALTE
jgi:hypothetical protein